jgi:hypothetical protein
MQTSDLGIAGSSPAKVVLFTWVWFFSSIKNQKKVSSQLNTLFRGQIIVFSAADSYGLFVVYPHVNISISVCADVSISRTVVSYCMCITKCPVAITKGVLDAASLTLLFWRFCLRLLWILYKCRDQTVKRKWNRTLRKNSIALNFFSSCNCTKRSVTYIIWIYINAQHNFLF